MPDFDVFSHLECRKRKTRSHGIRNQRTIGPVSLTCVLRICLNQRLLRKSLNIALGQGQTTHYGQNFDVNRKASSLWSFVASLKRISSTSDFIHIFSWFNKCIYPQVRGRQPQATKFWCQQKPLFTSVICYKFKNKSLWSLILYNFFMILYMYIAPGQGLTTSWGCHLVISVICCKFQRNLFEVWFYTFCLMI